MQRLRCFSAALAYASFDDGKGNENGTITMVTKHDGRQVVERKERSQLDHHSRSDENVDGEWTSSPTLSTD